MNKILFILLLIAWPLLSFAEQEDILTPNEQFNYYIGYDTGQSVKEMVPDINSKQLAEGISAIIQNTSPTISRQEEKTIKRQLQESAMKDGKRKKPDSPIDINKLSYALGLDIGRSLKNKIQEPKLQIINTGLGDAIVGKASRLNAQQTKQMQKKLLACKQSSFHGHAAKQQQQSEHFLQENHSKPGINSTKNGLQYLIIKNSNSQKPLATDQVQVVFTATLLDGTIIDSSEQRGGPVTLSLANIISGLQEGLSLMGIGSKFRFFIPHTLAYGEKGVGALIPPYAILIYDVELLSIKRKALERTKKIDPLTAADCSFTDYMTAAKCFLNLWTSIKPITSDKEIKEMCQGVSTNSFFSNCVDVLSNRYTKIVQIKAKSANFNNFKITKDIPADHFVEVTFQETLVSRTKEKKYLTIFNFSITAAKDKSLWKISDCQIKEETLEQ